MQKTNIDYLTHTWNPIAMRCTPCSPGCAHCWHLKRADMLAKNPKIPVELQRIYSGGALPKSVQGRLKDPAKLKKPARIGVQFMGDLFHPDVAWNDQYKIFEWMLHVSWHTFVVLTKRPNLETMENIWFHLKRNYDCHIIPLPNVWFGVSVCNNDELHKIETLLQIPAAVRWVSFEPMLGPIKLSLNYHSHGIKGHRKIDWVVCGGETGPGARPMNPAWAISIRDQCVSAGVPFFFKQWGGWLKTEHCEPFTEESIICDGVGYRKVDKKKAGRLLDGKVWDQYPKVI